jgi:hypothetical protein
LAKEKDKEVTITSTKGPTIYIEMPQEHKCLIANVRLTFFERVADDEFKAAAMYLILFSLGSKHVHSN